MSSHTSLLAALTAVTALASLAAGCDSEGSGTGGTTTTSGTTSSSTTTSSSGTGGTGGSAPTACQARIQAKITANQAALASWSIADVAAMAASKATAPPGDTKYAGHYRDDLTTHPGCKPRTSTDKTYTGAGFLNTANTATVAPGVGVQGTDATKAGYVPGYPCAAKEYAQPSGVTIDTTKPIVVLVHGNSSSPNSWEEYANLNLTDADTNQNGIQLVSASSFKFTADDQTKPRQMLAAKLVAKGYRVIAVDFRADVVPTLANVQLAATSKDPGYGDSIGNIDHGWAVPILESLIQSLMVANPTQKISLVGHSLGSTIIQDSLRRTYNAFKAGTFAVNPFSRIHGVVLASGAIHGVAGGSAACALYTTMRGTVNCELGDRDNYSPTDFHNPNNGPADLFAVPCADGSYAFNKQGECGGNTIAWFTTTIQDSTGAKLADEFVSQSAARINMDNWDATNKVVVAPDCVDNHVNSPSDYDSSGFFFDLGTYPFQGFLANHFGTIRSDEGMAYIVTALGK